MKFMKMHYKNIEEIISVKNLYIIFSLSLLANVLLSIYLIRVKPICERHHIDEIDWSYEEVPDEIMAREIADAVEMERIDHRDKSEYDVVAGFNSQSNEWEITYEFDESDGIIKKDIICIRKDNGLITIQRRFRWVGDEE